MLTKIVLEKAENNQGVKEAYPLRRAHPNKKICS